MATVAQRIFYQSARFALTNAFLPALQIRCRGRQRVPAGGALICANHQSFLDPMVLGVALSRPLNYLARHDLFQFPMGPAIRALNAIPLDREGLALSGMKEVVRRLRDGELVLIFPEGTRCVDGNLGRLLPGVATLARRGAAPLVPVGLDGTFQAWPRHKRLPRPGRVQLCVGDPIYLESRRAAADPQCIAELSSRLRAAFLEARRLRRRRLMA